MQKKSKLTLICILIFSFLFPFVNPITEASIIDALKERIKSKSEEVEKIKQEINVYQKELENTSVKAKSLTQDLNVLTSTKKKIETDINVTEKNITKTTSTIKELQDDIIEKEDKIINNRLVIEKMIKNLHQDSSDNLIESMLEGQSLSTMGEYLDHTEKFQEKIKTQISELFALRDELSGRKQGAELKKRDLSNLKTELSSQKTSVAETQAQKDKLLKATKNQQTEYQKILAEKIKQKEAFEKEIFTYESELKLSIDQNKLPSIRGGILQWPLANVRITQYFGATVDAKRLYVSGSHNGIDLGAPDGTKLTAALSGTVWATGNTDLKQGCYSYGKWVLIKHNNGLSTLYAHMSAVGVKAGDELQTGDTIGLSGRTGYVTGPHLHFTVLATEGTRVGSIPPERTVNCRGVTMPLADTKAYLDPILYLPKL